MWSCAPTSAETPAASLKSWPPPEPAPQHCSTDRQGQRGIEKRCRDQAIKQNHVVRVVLNTQISQAHNQVPSDFAILVNGRTTGQHMGTLKKYRDRWFYDFYIPASPDQVDVFLEHPFFAAFAANDPSCVDMIPRMSADELAMLILTLVKDNLVSSVAGTLGHLKLVAHELTAVGQGCLARAIEKSLPDLSSSFLAPADALTLATELLGCPPEWFTESVQDTRKRVTEALRSSVVCSSKSKLTVPEFSALASSPLVDVSIKNGSLVMGAVLHNPQWVDKLMVLSDLNAWDILAKRLADSEYPRTELVQAVKALAPHLEEAQLEKLINSGHIFKADQLKDMAHDPNIRAILDKKALETVVDPDAARPRSMKM